MYINALTKYELHQACIGLMMAILRAKYVDLM